MNKIKIVRDENCTFDLTQYFLQFFKRMIVWNDPEEEEVNHFSMILDEDTAVQWGEEMVLGDMTWKRLDLEDEGTPYQTSGNLSF